MANDRKQPGFVAKVRSAMGGAGKGFAKQAMLVAVALSLAASGLVGCQDRPAIQSQRNATINAKVVYDCTPAVEQQEELGKGEIGDLDTNVKKIYDILKALGGTDVNIAGVLGNWANESGFDPSGVEGIYDEPFQMGPRKTEAMANPEAFTVGWLFPQYAGGIDGGTYGVAYDAYIGSDGQHWPGIGLGGFTGPGCTDLLAYAEKIGYDWYTIEAQLSFITAEEGGYWRNPWFIEWIKTTESSPEEAAATFLAKWEGCPGVRLDRRAASAREWYEKIQSFTPDESYGKSVLALASQSGKAKSTKVAKSPTKTLSNKNRVEGNKIDIPDEFDALQHNYGWGGGYKCLVEGVHTGMEGWWVCWKEYDGPQGDVARRWYEQGEPYLWGDDVPLIDDRAGVAVKGTYGEAGDYIDIYYKDGNMLHAIILDSQGGTDDAGGMAAWSDYGHNTPDQLCNVLEWYTDGNGEAKLISPNGANPCGIPGFEFITGTVDYIVNTNGVNTGGVNDKDNMVTDEECHKAEEEEEMDIAAGEAAAVDPSTTARLEWLYGSEGCPQSEAENEKWLETFDVTIRDLSGNKTTIQMTMHKKLKTEVQALFEDIYANTDFKIDPGDTGSLRAWDSEAGRYSGAQSNSNHAYGLAIDINAMHNYCVYASGSVIGYSYDPGSDPLAVTDKVVEIFKKHGFFWGGDWTDPKDYMHFAYTDH